MNTRLKNRAIALLSAILLSQQAAAIEEVVVYGTDTSVKTESVAEKIHAAMSEFVAELNEAQKLRLDAELAKIGERRIQIAASTLPTRG